MNLQLYFTNRCRDESGFSFLKSKIAGRRLKNIIWLARPKPHPLSGFVVELHNKLVIAMNKTLLE